MLLSTHIDHTYFMFKLGPADVDPATEVRMEVTVYPQWFHSVKVEWTPLSTWVDKNPRYNVYRSHTQVGNYELLNSTPITDPFLLESEDWNSSKFDNDWWTIETILDDDTRYVSAPVTVSTKRGTFQNNRSREINRREWVLLRKFTGSDTYLFRRKNHGQRCPECWDTVTRKITKSKCTTCYGVSFTGGYYSPIPTKVQYDARVENKQYAYFGKFEANQIGAWTIAYPDIEVHDLLMRVGDKKVYRVEQIQNTELLNNTVRQIMRVTEIAKEGVEYCLLEDNGIHLESQVQGLNL